VAITDNCFHSVVLNAENETQSIGATIIEILSDAPTVLAPISVFIAALTFIYGVRAWRREFVGKRRIELAEDVLALGYEIEDIIRSFRSPFSYASEGQDRTRSNGETPEESTLLDRAYVVIERYNKKEERIALFRALRYRFMATFGTDSGEPFDEIDQVIKDIFFSAHMLGSHYWPRQGRAEMNKEEFRKHLDEMHTHERVFWNMGEQYDEIGPRVRQAIEKLEKHAKEAAI